MARVLVLTAAMLLVGGALVLAQPAAGTRPARKPTPTTVAQGKPIQATRCRMTLFKDQPVAAGRSGILEFVGRRIETGKDEDGEPVYEIEELDVGTDVKEGEVIAQLVDDVPDATYRVAKTEAENDVEIRFQQKATEVAQAQLDSALLANRKLPGTYPDIELKKFRLDVEKGALATEQAQHQFKILKMKASEAAATLDSFRIRAPFDGVITQVLLAKGQAVREGDPIFEMANTHRVRVEGMVDRIQGRQLRRGMKVIVQQENESGDLEERKFEGTVLFVDLQLEKVNQTKRVVAEVINEDEGLVAGRLATMTFVTTPSTASK